MVVHCDARHACCGVYTAPLALIWVCSYKGLKVYLKFLLLNSPSLSSSLPLPLILFPFSLLFHHLYCAEYTPYAESIVLVP